MFHELPPLRTLDERADPDLPGEGGMLRGNAVEQLLPPFDRLDGAVGVLAVGEALGRRIAGDVGEHEAVSERKKLRHDPAHVVFGTVLQHVSAYHAVEAAARQLAVRRVAGVVADHLVYIPVVDDTWQRRARFGLQGMRLVLEALAATVIQYCLRARAFDQALDSRHLRTQALSGKSELRRKTEKGLPLLVHGAVKALQLDVARAGMGAVVFHAIRRMPHRIRPRRIPRHAILGKPLLHSFRTSRNDIFYGRGAIDRSASSMAVRSWESRVSANAALSCAMASSGRPRSA